MHPYLGSRRSRPMPPSRRHEPVERLHDAMNRYDLDAFLERSTRSTEVKRPSTRRDRSPGRSRSAGTGRLSSRARPISGPISSVRRSTARWSGPNGGCTGRGPTAPSSISEASSSWDSRGSHRVGSHLPRAGTDGRGRDLGGAPSHRDRRRVTVAPSTPNPALRGRYVLRRGVEGNGVDDPLAL